MVARRQVEQQRSRRERARPPPGLTTATERLLTRTRPRVGGGGMVGGAGSKGSCFGEYTRAKGGGGQSTQWIKCEVQAGSS